MRKKVLFLTGTRADFGKLKPLMQAVDNSPLFDCRIFVTGMHTLSLYGYTVDEVYKTGFKNIQVYMNQIMGEPMDLIMANTIGGFSRYVHELKPNLIVVHGDRVEALAGAIVGAFNNIRVAHVEGGELSGTIDELIRHTISKLSHAHFVANEEAALRLRQMGEQPEAIFVIGSPDIDVMLSENLPTIEEVKKWYGINFEEYSVALFHSVTTEIKHIEEYCRDYVDALLESGLQYVVLYPNNDPGNEYILQAYKKVEKNPRFKIFPSMRFEYFLRLLKESNFIIGNSSAGVREAPVFAIPAVNIGSRQEKRSHCNSIINCRYSKEDILLAINEAVRIVRSNPVKEFGSGQSAKLFLDCLHREEFWQIPRQKQFVDLT